jgi:hypothetical protein
VAKCHPYLQQEADVMGDAVWEGVDGLFVEFHRTGVQRQILLEHGCQSLLLSRKR